MSKDIRNIVVLGGSYAGLSIAHHILKHTVPTLPSQSSTYQVVLVTPSKKAFCRPAAPRALIDDSLLDQSKLFTDIPKAFAQYPSENFCFVHGKAIKLDHAGRKVDVVLCSGDADKEAEIKALDYHALIIATGASTPSPLLSFNGSDAASMRASWAAFRDALSSAKSIVIAGGGPAGIETAGDLGEYLNGKPGWFASELKDPNVDITVVTGAERILPHLRPALAEKAEAMLAKVGVKVIKKARVKESSKPSESADKDAVASKTTVTLEDGRTLDADLYIPAMGFTYNTDFIDSSLLTEDGRVKVDPATLRADEERAGGPRVYAAGDVGSYARPAVHHIMAAIPVLGANIKRDLLLAAAEEAKTTGEGDVKVQVPEGREFNEDTRETQLVPIGTSGGVGAGMGWKMPSVVVWLIKGRNYGLWLSTASGMFSGKQWTKE